MAKFLITYDLVGTTETSKDYKRLIEKIEAHPDWVKVQKSVWVVRSSKSARAIRDNLWAAMDGDDRLLVIKVSSGAAWKNPLCETQPLKDLLSG